MRSQASLIREWAKRGLTLVVAPLVISLAANIVTSLATGSIVPAWLWAITLILIPLVFALYLIAYTGKFERVLFKCAQRLRARRFKKPRVLILNGMLGDGHEVPPKLYYTDRTPTDWQAALATTGWDIEVGPMRCILGSPAPDIVINPFGEVYPEDDFGIHTTFSQIRDYVYGGGVFVNVAGYPFWYQHNPRTGVSQEAARFERVADNPKLFKWKPLLADTFPHIQPDMGSSCGVESMQTDDDRRRFDEIAGVGGSLSVKMFRAYALGGTDLLPLLRDKERQKCIIGSLAYGQGYFLLAGVVIDQTNTGFQKVLAAIKGWAAYETRGRTP